MVSRQEKKDKGTYPAHYVRVTKELPQQSFFFYLFMVTHPWPRKFLLSYFYL
jgi:hypothetical protein